jgi:hypothetical protein
MKLDESYSENVECPYCGWESAESDYDRSGVGGKVVGGRNYEYNVHRWCDLCGWNLYALDDEHFDELVQEIYDEYEDEEEAEKQIPEQEIEYPPLKQNVETAKKIQPLVDDMPDMGDEGNDVIWEFIIDEWSPGQEDKRTPEQFMHGLIDWILSREA